MTAVLIDANVLLDVMTEDARWLAWSAGAIERAADNQKGRRPMQIPWWISECQTQGKTTPLWSAMQRRGALRAWLLAILFLALIMPPVDILLYDLGTGDIIGGGVSAAFALLVGMFLSNLICRRLWPALMAPDEAATRPPVL
jgi:hypothetical protein